jgi:hypothetical protein
VSWNDLAYMGLTVKPFGGTKPPPGHRFSQFSAGLTATLGLLSREMSSLSAARIVVELDVQDSDIRLDGYPRANARIGNPAVAVSFESRYGPLRYATCEFTDWRDNLRAIALSMEALRKVDRYGVSKRGEQYQGWKAIPMSTDPADAIQTEAQARAYLDEKWGGDVRQALFETHPDRGGDEDEFRKVIRAKELIA